MSDKVIVRSSARIHCNSLKMNTKGRRGGGGLGFSTKQPQLEFVCSTFNQCRIITADKILENVVSGYANKMCDEYHLPGILVEIKNSYPVHFGLGSETQSALAVGNALKELYQKRNISNEEIAKSTGVAGVSGIGYYSFAKGGFIIEAGYPMAPDLEKKNFAIHSTTPPVFVMNYAVPKEFKLLLIIPKQSPTTNFTREDENRLFADYATSPKEIGIICTSTLMGVIPGLITRDYTTFVKNLMQISHLGTKKVELELNRSWIFHVQEILNKFIDFRYQRNKETDFSLSNDNGNTLSELLKGTDEIVLKRPIPWLGLSSLGPTLYSFIDSRIYDTVSLQKEIKQIINDDSKVLITEVNNDKALIQRIES